MAKKLPERKIEMTAHQEMIKTPAGKAMNGGIDKIAEDIKMQDTPNAYGIIFGGVNSVKKWSDFKSLQGKTIFSINEQISVTSKEILTEIKKISTAIETSNFEIPFLQHISESFDLFAIDALKYFNTKDSVIIPVSQITFSMDKNTASSVGKIASSLKEIDDKTLKSLSNLIGVLQKYEKVNLQGIFNNIVTPLTDFSKTNIKNLSSAVQGLNDVLNGKTKLSDVLAEFSDSRYDAILAPAKVSIAELGSIVEVLSVISEDFDKKTSEKIKESFTGLYDLATSTSYGFGKILEAYLLNEDYDLTDALIQIKTLTDIINKLKEVSGLYDKKMTVALSAIHDLVTNKDTSLKEIFDSFSNLPNISNNIVSSIDGIVLIIEDFKALSQLISKQDIDSIQLSIAAMKDTIDGETKDNLKALIESIASIEVTDDFDKKIEPVITASDSLYEVFSKDYNQLSKNAEEMLVSFEKLIEVIKKLPEIDAKNGLKKKTAIIVKEMEGYEKNMKIALDVQKKGMEHTKAIIDGTETMCDDIEEVSKDIKKSGNKENEVAINNLASVILAMGAMMIIGSLITAKEPNFIRDAYRFGAALVVFITMVSLPIFIAQGLSSKANQKATEGLGRVVFGMGMTMVIGALFYTWIPDFSKNVKLFILDMTLFVFGLAFTLTRMSKLLEFSQSPVEIGKLVVRCAIIMLIGALFVQAQGGALVKSALIFGVVLSAFMFCVLTPLLLLTALLGPAENNIAGFGRLIVTCSLVMLIGSFFISDKETVKNSLKFGAVLGLFILTVLAPIWLVAKSLEKDIITIKRIGGLILESSFILMLGGLFMSNPKFAAGALDFALLTAVFIGTVVFAVSHASKRLGVKAFKFLHEFNKMIVNMALALMIGGVFMSNKALAKGAVDFALLTIGFTLVMCLATRFISKTFNKKALLAVYALSLTVATFGLIMMFGGAFINKFGFKNVLLFATGLALFTVIMGGVFWLLSKFKKPIAEGAFIGIMMAMGISWLAVSMMLVHLAVMNTSFKEIFIFATGVAVMALIFGIIGVDPIADYVFTGAVVAGAIAIGVALLGVSFLIMGLAAKTISWESLALVLAATGALVGIFAIIGVPIVAALVLIGSAAIAAMGVALLSLGISFMLVANLADMNVEGGAKKITEGLYALLDSFTVLGILSPLLLLGAATGTLLGVALTALSIGFFMLAALTSIKVGDKEITIVDAANALGDGLNALVGPFAVLGLMLPLYALALGSAAMLSASIISLSAAFSLLWCATQLDIVTAAGILKEALGEVRWIFAEMALWVIFLPLATASATMLTVSIIAMSGAFALMGAVADDTLVDSVQKFGAATDAAIDVFSQYGLWTLASMSVGTVIAIELAVAVSAMSNAFVKLHNAVELSKETPITAINDLGNILAAAIGIFDSSDDNSPFKEDRLLSLIKTGWLVNFALMPMIRVTSKIMNLVKDFSSLMIPNDWDDKGNPISYKRLNTSDFVTAAENIKDTVKCLVKGFAELIKDPDIAEFIEDFKSSDSGNVFTSLLGGGNSKLSVLVRMTRGISKVISSVGLTIADLASRQIPNEWDKNGKPIGYVSLTSQDMKAAAQSIVDVLEVMLTGLSDFGTKHKTLLEEYGNEGFWTNLFGGSKSTLGLTIKASKGIGEIISNTATGIAKYASLSVPDEWNKEGKPVHFRQLQEQDFKDAAKNIGIILSNMLDAINNAPNMKKSIEDIEEITKGISAASNLLGDVAKIIIDYKSLRIPIFKNDKLEPSSYRIITSQDFIDFGVNVKQILTSIPNAISEGYQAFKSEGITTDKLKEIIEAFAPMSQMLVNLVESIKTYASLKSIPVLDKEGKIVKFIEVDLNKDLASMGTNVKSILVGMIEAVTTGYKGFKDLMGDKYDAKEIENIINAVKPVGDLLKTLIESVDAYANLKIAKYGEKGELIGYDTLLSNGKSFDKIFNSISTNISKILSGLITAVHTAINENDWLLDENKRKKILTPLSRISEVMDPVKQAIDLVKNYTELKFPKGFDNEGKATGYYSISKIPFDILKSNITQFIVVLPNAVNEALQTVEPIVNALIENNRMEDFKSNYTSINDFISKDVYPAIKAYAEYKIPLEFDKDGKPTKYFELNQRSLNNLTTLITAMVVALPNAMNNALDKLKDNPFDDIKVEEIGKFASAVEAASNILDRIYNGSTIDNMLSLVNNIDRFNRALSDVARKTEDTNTLEQTTVNNIMSLFDIIDNNFVKGEFIKEKRDSIVLEAKSVIEGITQMLDNMTNIGEAKKSFFGMRVSSGLEEYKDKLRDFARIVHDLSLASRSLVTVNNDLSQINEASTAKGADMLSSIKGELDKISDENVKHLKEEGEGLSKYVKTINSINTRKVNDLTRMFETIERFNNSVGSLDRFTTALSDKIAVILTEFTVELKNAEKTISNADALRKEREKTMNKTLDRIAEIMSKTLNVKVTSGGTSDVTEAVSEIID